MKNLTIVADNVGKSFQGRKLIFSGVNFVLKNYESLAICGRNGSGKSTLLKMIAGALKPSSGEISFKLNEKSIEKNELLPCLGFVAPYLNLYEEFTPLEHAKILSEIRGITFDKDLFFELIRKFKLETRSGDQIRTFSSGMKQRVKFILALIHKPELLLLDEPSTNLDKDGIAIMSEIIKNHEESGGCIIIATNEDYEKSLCQKEIIINKN